MKRYTKAILFSLGGTALGLMAAAIAKAMLHYKIFKQAGVIDLVKEMFPDEDWKYRNIFFHLKGFDLKFYATDEFIEANPDAEDNIRAALLEKTPELEKISFSIKILPMSKLKSKCNRSIMFECRKDEQPESSETEEVL